MSRAKTPEDKRIEDRIRRRYEQAAADGVDWWIMRIATSPHFSDTFAAVAHEWSWRDQVHAHMTLDALDDAAHLARAERG